MSTTSLVYDSGFGNGVAFRTVVLTVSRIDLGAGTFDLNTIGVPNTFTVVGTSFAAHVSSTGNLITAWGNSTLNGAGCATTTTGTVLTMTYATAPANTTITVVLQLLRNPVT